MRDLGSAMMSSVAHKMSGDQEREQKGAAYRLDRADVEALTRDWPDAPSRAVKQMVEQYGPPNEGTPVRLVWYYNGPWKRTEVTRDEIDHNFPAPHTDFLTNWIDYPVPVEKADALTRYDGSCLLDRTAGEAGARCDSEVANFITLNLMHEIVTGKRTVDEARETYAQQMSAFMLGRSASYAEQLLFDPPKGGTADKDESMISGAMANQMGQKVMDVVAGEPDSDTHF